MTWLKEHKEIAEAQFVYQSWLDAGGELKVVEKEIRAWLKEHKEVVSGMERLCKAWEERGGVALV